MAKENHRQQEQKEKRKEPHFATSWMTYMVEILNDAYRKQMDIGLDRLNRVAKTNIDLVAGWLDAVSPPKTEHHQKDRKITNYWETDFD